MVWVWRGVSAASAVCSCTCTQSRQQNYSAELSACAAHQPHAARQHGLCKQACLGSAANAGRVELRSIALHARRKAAARQLASAGAAAGAQSPNGLLVAQGHASQERELAALLRCLQARNQAAEACSCGRTACMPWVPATGHRCRAGSQITSLLTCSRRSTAAANRAGPPAAAHSGPDERSRPAGKCSAK